MSLVTCRMIVTALDTLPYSCLRASKGCVGARTIGADGAPVGAAEPALVAGALPGRGGPGLVVLAGEDAVPARGRRGAQRQGDREPARALDRGRVAGRGRPRAEGLRDAARVRDGSAVEARVALRPWPRGREPGIRGPPAH